MENTESVLHPLGDLRQGIAFINDSRSHRPIHECSLGVDERWNVLVQGDMFTQSASREIRF